MSGDPLRRCKLQLKSSPLKAAKRPWQSTYRDGAAALPRVMAGPPRPAASPAFQRSVVAAQIFFSREATLAHTIHRLRRRRAGAACRSPRGAEAERRAGAWRCRHTRGDARPAAATGPSAGLLCAAAVPAPRALPQPPQPGAVTGGPAPQVLGILGAMFSGKENVHCIHESSQGRNARIIKRLRCTSMQGWTQLVRHGCYS